MATTPTDRYQTAAELLVDIRAALQQLGSGRLGMAPAVPPRRRRRGERPSVGRSPRRSRRAAGRRCGLQLAGGRRTALTDRDRILIGAFDEHHRRTAVRRTLVTALKAQLSQSPFLDIVPDERIRETLRSMSRDEDER